jgi:hypothetical protein
LVYFFFSSTKVKAETIAKYQLLPIVHGSYSPKRDSLKQEQQICYSHDYLVAEGVQKCIEEQFHEATKNGTLVH